MVCLDSWTSYFLITISTLSVSFGGSGGSHLSISPKDTEYVKYVNETHHVLCLSPHPGISITWSHLTNGSVGEKLPSNKGRIHTEERTGKVNGVALIFESIENKDKGEYSCSAINEGIQAKVNFKLIVIKPISFLNTPLIQKARENQDALVTCEVDGDPMPTIVWHVKGVKLNESNSKFQIGDDGLFIKNVTRNDKGEYQCRAFQTSQIISNIMDQKIQLQIQHKPSWASGSHQEKPIEVFAYLTGVVNLTCDAVADPPAKYQWTKNKQMIAAARNNITIFDEVDRSTLQLVVDNKSVFADYVCNASNAIGSVKRTFKLQEGFKPMTPAHIRIGTIQIDSAELEVTNPATEKASLLGYRIQYLKHLANKEAVKWSDAENVDLVLGSNYIIGHLDADTNYVFRVASQSRAGMSDFSTSHSFRTLKRNTHIANAGAKNMPSVVVVIVTCVFLAIAISQ